jgi:hypothetical protein
MDATRPRRLRDDARRRWYAQCRCRRLARLLGFSAGHGEARKKPAAR